jgi:prepilin-type processing-associated H-X9-DG protein
MQSMYNMRQALMGCILYANDHQDTLPESLDVLVKDKVVPESTVVNPRDPKKRQFEYRRWVVKLSQFTNAAESPIMWEVVDTDSERLAVGFVDGHVEVVRSKKELEETYLKKMEELAKKAGGGNLP